MIIQVLIKRQNVSTIVGGVVRVDRRPQCTGLVRGLGGDRVPPRVTTARDIV